MTRPDNRLPPLPQPFLARVQAQLGDEFPAFLRSYDVPAQRGIFFRRQPPSSAQSNCLGRVPWAENGWYLRAGSTLGNHPLHEAGAYYLQEPSAMAPAQVLAPKADDLVLDLCAAPGGKSIQIAHQLTRGALLCNEPVPQRAQTLSRNIERMGIACAAISCEAPQRLAQRLGAVFDCVLVDAPCSGEGMFRKDPLSRLAWTEEGAAGCAKRQTQILSDAALLVKSGGRVVYSTCTFNPAENEGLVAQFLRSHPQFSLLAFQVADMQAESGMLQLWPHRVRGEGQFMALLIRDGSPAEEAFSASQRRQAAGNVPEALRSLLEHISPLPWQPTVIEGDQALLLPESLPALDGLRILRRGLRAANLVGRTWQVDHALSHAYPSRASVDLTLDEARRYLRGESLDNKPGEGWAAACYKGYALGWGKLSGGLLKNHYPKELRRG